jgi:uncharacterized damage-inducible protein DinB
MTRKPEANEYPSSYSRYIERVPESDVVAAMEAQSGDTAALLQSIDDARAGHRYAEGKWSIKEVLGHIADAERVFGYRLVSFSRADAAPLPSFEEEDWTREGSFDAWPLADLVEHFGALRKANLLALRNLREDAWDRVGTANDNEASVRALAYCLLGHERHHLGVLRERYL